jgi:hypothetical protein
MTESSKQYADTIHRLIINIEFHRIKETVYVFLMGRGDFSRPDFGRLKPPLPET